MAALLLAGVPRGQIVDRDGGCNFKDDRRRGLGTEAWTDVDGRAEEVEPEPRQGGTRVQ